MLLIIATGGAIGSIARYITQVLLYRWHPTVFPLGTFMVNITGCLLIGIFYGLSEKGNLLSPEWRLFLTTGFCGGFTTFSTFAFENTSLLKNGDFLYFGMNAIGSVILGIAGVYLGILIIKSL